jgi:hypothetical protein
MGHMRATTFGAKEANSDNLNTNIKRQQDNKGKEAKGR